MQKTMMTVMFAAAAVSSPLFAMNEFEGPLSELAKSELAAWTTDPSILAAIAAQNAAHAALTSAEIESLDAAWKAEVGAAAAPTIAAVIERPASAWLRERKEASGGLVTEVIIMDKHGLNVAQSDVTSDFWQGDEDKFQKTYGVGPDALHVSEVELDESTQTYQSQVSLTVVDPATGEPIGAATFGIDVSLLN